MNISKAKRIININTYKKYKSGLSGAWMALCLTLCVVMGWRGSAMQTYAQESTPVYEGETAQTHTEEVQSENQQKTTKLLSWLEEQMQQGAVTCEEDMLTAISLGEEKFGITVPQGMKDAIVALMVNIQNLGLEPGVLLSEASNLYAQYGEYMNGTVDKDFFAMIWEAIKNFFVAVWEFIVDFVKGLLDLIL